MTATVRPLDLRLLTYHLDMKPTAADDITKASLHASDEVHKINLRLQSGLSPSASTTTVRGGGNAGPTVMEDHDPALSMAKEMTNEESKTLSKAQIQVVFLAFVLQLTNGRMGPNRACRLSVAAFLGSLDQTIISTAMPTIASQYNALPQQSCMYSRQS